MLLPATFTCAACGESIETAVDPAQGRTQSYVEDCQVCCRPNVLSVRLRGHSAEVSAEAE